MSVSMTVRGAGGAVTLFEDPRVKRALTIIAISDADNPYAVWMRLDEAGAREIRAELDRFIEQTAEEPK